MKNNGLIILGVAILAGLVISASNYTKPAYRVANTTPVDKPGCVDFDPPSQTETITVAGTKYLLVKRNAGISVEKVQEDLKKIGEVDGKTVSVAMSPNYFNQSLDGMAFLASGNKDSKGFLLFDIYIKDGMPIPEYVKNCKQIGGSSKIIDYWKTSQFPPAAFNQTDVQGGDVLKDPAYMYDDIIMSFVQLKALKGAKPAGTLFVKSKNKSYQLYTHLSSAYLVDGNDAYEYIPSDRPIALNEESKDNLQLKWFYLVNSPVYSWWTLICKPAIYVYPHQTQEVAVKVHTPGEFTLTIPQYPVGGWKVVADPDGTIHSGGQTYPYLYYESKVEDSLVKKPDQGYVRSYNDLPALYDYLLPKLGLNAKESKEFKEYWNKSLPYSPYYFVGVMPEDDVNALEPLEISPAPDTLVRVRVYFTALTERKEVVEPELTTPERKGFVVSEWGGAIKSNPNSKFTCIQ